VPVESFAAVFGPPPAQPPVFIDWLAVEGWLELALPADYKAIASAYGPLLLGDRVFLHVPCVNDQFDYGTWTASTHRSCRDLARQVAAPSPPAFHPSPGGLLAWGMTVMSQYLFWDTAASDDPDRWPVVLFDSDCAHRGDDPWHHLGTPLMETLVASTRAGIKVRGASSGPHTPRGPVPATAQPTPWLLDAAPWSPPPPATTPDPRRRAALTDGTGLEALSALVPPPAAPQLGDGAWEDLFGLLGTHLPADYVALMDRYGAGEWLRWLRFSAPLQDGGALFVGHVEGTLDAYRELRDEFPEDYPLPVWPEPGGFLPCASSRDGDSLGWLTQGDPDSWSLIVHPRHAEQGPPLPGRLTETLLEWSRGRLAAAGLPGLDQDDDPLDLARFDDVEPEH
jgi:hypothetical protein